MDKFEAWLRQRFEIRRPDLHGGWLASDVQAAWNAAIEEAVKIVEAWHTHGDSVREQIEDVATAIKKLGEGNA